MTMPWLKLYHEARTDPKLRAISRDQHYVWFNILCFANEQPERGVIKVDDEEVLACAVADGDVDLLRSSLERLTKLRLVDRSEDTISPHGWGERQGKVDATSAERAKRYRERHKSSSGKRKTASRVTERDATRDERVRERDVTDRHATVTEKSRTDREREEEKKEKTTQERVDVLKFGSQPQEQEPAPEYPEGDGGMYEITPSTYPMDQDRARAIFKMLWTGWSNRRMCFDFYQRQQFYQDEVWIAAIRNAKHRDVAVGSLGYIEKIAADYQANGIPKPKPAQASSRHSSPPSIPLPPLHPPGTVIPAKYYNPPSRTGSA